MRFALLAAAAAMSCAAPGQARAIFTACTNGCYYDLASQAGGAVVDYTVPDDGLTYLWTLRIESADPLATIAIGGPNQVQRYVKYYGGTEEWFWRDFDFTFIETVSPHLTTFIVSAPKGYDNCADGGPIGAICSEKFIVYGNGGTPIFTSTADMTVFSSITAIPEPASWAMMIAGFGIIGTAFRRQARQLPLSSKGPTVTPDFAA